MNWFMNFIMKLFLLSIFLFFSYLVMEAHILYRQPSTVNRQPSNNLNRSAFYKAMQENNKDLVNGQLTELQTVPVNIRDAFTGAMLMKKAGLGGSPATKLHLFKEGHKMLEAAIKKD